MTHEKIGELPPSDQLGILKTDPKSWGQIIVFGWDGVGADSAGATAGNRPPESDVKTLRVPSRLRTLFEDNVGQVYLLDQ